MNLQIKKATKNNIPIILEYLVKREFTCISLMSHVLSFNEKESLYFIYNNQIPLSANNITGVILITNYGVVLHSIEHASKQLLFKYFNNANLFSIAGTMDGSTIIESMLKKKPSTIFDYDLLTYNYNIQTRKQIKPLSENHKIIQCTFEDLEKLYFLQYNYQIEEVLPKGRMISENQCCNILYDRLKKHTVFAIKDSRNKFIAMAGTNAIGYNYAQLGGIYTDKSHRGQGLAQNLVQHIVLNSNKKTALFVKKNNISAQKAYKNVGFEDTTIDYRICYI